MKKILSKLDKPLLIFTIIFFIFGLIMILSASSMESYMRYAKSPYYYFFKQLIFLGSGSVLFLFVTMFPTRNYKKLGVILMVVFTLALFALTIYGYTSHNAQSWFQIGPISIQPSEFIKVIIIVYMAAYYDKNKDNLTNQWTITKPLLWLPILFFLIAFQPDLGTAGIIALLVILIFYSVPMQKKYRKPFNKLFVGGILLVLAIFVTTKFSFLPDYQLKRFNFTAPCDRYSKPDDSGYQLCNSFIAFKNGGLLGSGLGQSTQKYLYLPDSYTDFIFPIIIEEWGLWLGVLVLAGYVFMLYRMRRIAMRANNLRNSIIAYGVCMYLFLHVAVNLIGVMGIGPLTGVPLPFLSYGGSYTWSLFIALGLVQRVAIESSPKNA